MIETNQNQIQMNLDINTSYKSNIVEFTKAKRLYNNKSSEKNLHSTSLGSPLSDISDHERLYHQNIYVRPFCHFDNIELDMMKETSDNERAHILSNDINNCDMSLNLLNKKRASSDTCLNIITKNETSINVLTNEDNFLDIMDTFDKLSIELSPLKEKFHRKLLKKKEIKRQVIINKTDFSIFDRY